LAAKCYLLFIIQMLVVIYEHTIMIHACMDGGDLGVTEGTRQVNA